MTLGGFKSHLSAQALWVLMYINETWAVTLLHPPGRNMGPRTESPRRNMGPGRQIGSDIMSLLQSYNLLLDSKNVFLGLKMWSSGRKGSPPLIPKCPLLYIFTIKHLKKLTFDRMILCLTLLRLTEAWHFCHIVLSSVILLLRISDRDRSCVRHGSTRLTFDIVESRMHRDFAGNLTFVKEYREARLFVLASVDTEHRN